MHTESDRERIRKIVTEEVAPFVPRDCAREIAIKVAARVAEGVDFVVREHGTILEEVAAS